jgi:hypothetical protein
MIKQKTFGFVVVHSHAHSTIMPLREGREGRKRERNVRMRKWERTRGGEERRGEVR